MECALPVLFPVDLDGGFSQHGWCGQQSWGQDLAESTDMFGEFGLEKMARVVRKLIASRGIKKIDNVLRKMGAIFLEVRERSYIYGKGINSMVLDQNWGTLFELVFLI